MNIKIEIVPTVVLMEILVSSKERTRNAVRNNIIISWTLIKVRHIYSYGDM
jgi:hypothetical protein